MKLSPANTAQTHERNQVCLRCHPKRAATINTGAAKKNVATVRNCGMPQPGRQNESGWMSHVAKEDRPGPKYSTKYQARNHAGTLTMATTVLRVPTKNRHPAPSMIGRYRRPGASRARSRVFVPR